MFTYVSKILTMYYVLTTIKIHATEVFTESAIFERLSHFKDAGEFSTLYD